MDISITQYNTTVALLFTIPVCWGIYELKQLNCTLKSYKKMIDDISKEDNLNHYPFIHRIKLLIDKSNRILH